jgi:hypothetical protein
MVALPFDAMAVEMPERVGAVAGASVVAFPWASATAAVSALNTAAARLTTHTDARGTMAGGLSDWAGGYREGFDSAYADAMSAATSVQETLALRAGAIVDAAAEANDVQTIRNAAASG